MPRAAATHGEAPGNQQPSLNQATPKTRGAKRRLPAAA